MDLALDITLLAVLVAAFIIEVVVIISCLYLLTIWRQIKAIGDRAKDLADHLDQVGQLAAQTKWGPLAGLVVSRLAKFWTNKPKD